MVHVDSCQGFGRTRRRYSVTGGEFALDCEMCFTTARGLEVTRLSAVDGNDTTSTTVFDTYVEPG